MRGEEEEEVEEKEEEKETKRRSRDENRHLRIAQETRNDLQRYLYRMASKQNDRNEQLP